MTANSGIFLKQLTSLVLCTLISEINNIALIILSWNTGSQKYNGKTFNKRLRCNNKRRVCKRVMRWFAHICKGRKNWINRWCISSKSKCSPRRVYYSTHIIFFGYPFFYIKYFIYIWKMSTSYLNSLFILFFYFSQSLGLKINEFTKTSALSLGQWTNPWTEDIFHTPFIKTRNYTNISRKINK